MYVYKKSDELRWAVGYYGPDGKWEPESSYTQKQWAAERVHYLNGGCQGAILELKMHLERA